MDNSIKEKITLIPSSELDLFRLLKSRLKVVFDVGARTDLEYYKLHSNCSYHLFEPNEEFLSELYQKLPAGFNHRIKINPFGLSYRNSENNLYYKNSQSFVINPIFKIGIDSGKRYKLQKLDNYVRENKIKHIDFLKIDTEGMDYQVILGGADTILKNKISFIQFEYWDGVRKFSEFLSDNYDLYLMIEPVLLRAILTKVYPKMTISQKKLNYQQSLIKIDRSVIDLIDNKIIPLGFGGNIFGVNKNLKNFRIKDLIINIPTVTFQTQCYENDYEYILLGNRLKHEIENCNYPFTHRILIINKVINKRYVAFLADRIKNAGIIDDYYFAEDYIDKALEYFEIRKDSFGGGYYYARVHLVGLYLCRTDYLMHFTTDSYIENKTDIPWIQDAIEIMQSDSRYACASAFWGESPKGACDEAVYDLGDWYAGYGFSDNCYLVPAGLFRKRIYNEYNQASERFPAHAGNSFEKRVDSYMHNHDLLRLISKKVGYKSIEIPSKLSTRIMESAGKITSWLITKSKSYKKTGDRKLKIGSKKDSKEIEEYRKTIKIFDIFTFFNELELLEIRLNMLAPFVDYFVIVECRQTFSGRKKPLYYDLNKDKFKKFDKKIIHYVVTGVPDSEEDLIKRLNRHTDPLEREIINYELTTDNFNKGETHWLKEFYQKESIRKALSVCKDNDICFVSDVDEIWNPEAAIDYRRDDVFKLKQTVYSYYLNNRSSEPWAGTLVTKYKNIKHNCLNHLRTARKTKYTFIENGGWHFTNQGGMERVIKKLESYGHQEFNTPEIKEKIGERIHENRDFIGRNFKFWLDESGLPEYILKNRNKYLNFFKNE